MKQFCCLLLARRVLFASFPILLFFAFSQLSCHHEKEYVSELHFPKTFTFQGFPNKHTNVYTKNAEQAKIELTREQAGTFIAFMDTIDAYVELDKTQIDFTSVEFLDKSRVRLFSDGSLGIPRLDTIVGYTLNDGRLWSTITVEWMLLDAPLVLTFGGSSEDQYLSLTPVWFYYTYHPFEPPFKQKYSSLRVIYSDYMPLTDLSPYLFDFENGDTLALHWENMSFK